MKNLLFGLFLFISLQSIGQITYEVPTNGTLLEVIATANIDGDASIITFNVSQDGSIIPIDGQIELLEDGTTIDGDIDGDGKPNVGLSLTQNVDFIVINSSNNVINGVNLQAGVPMTTLTQAAIRINAGTNNTITGCYIGTDLLGSTATPDRFRRGILLQNLSTDNTIGSLIPNNQNVISNVQLSGISAVSGSDRLTVQGSFIGTDYGGNNIIANGDNGIELNSVTGTTIGANGSVRNVISGNNFAGIEATSSANTVIINNHIGVSGTGNVDLGNGRDGIIFRTGCDNSQIGDGSPGNGNVISGNGFDGIELSGVTGISILGNIVGLGRNGSTIIGNGEPSGGQGVLVSGTSTGIKIGDATTNGRNVISGNRTNGILVSTSSAASILGNFVGLNSSGTLARGNTSGGITISNAGTGNVVGDGTIEGRNVVSGNNWGIAVQNDGTQILGNYIGTNAAGTGNVANLNEGIRLTLNARNTQIGDGTSDGANVIGFNLRGGILLAGDLVQNNRIVGNFIGIGNNGIANIGNTGAGILLENGTDNNLIQRNNIQNNTGDGIQISGSGGTTDLNAVTENSISANFLKGIAVVNGAQGSIPLATIDNIISLNAATFQIQGTAQGPNYTIEAFADTGDEGLVFLGNALSDAGDAFTIDVKWDQIPAGLTNITVTQTSEDPNTSEFSLPFALTTPDPLIVTTTENASVIGSLRYATEYVNNNVVASPVITFDPIIQNQQINLESPVLITSDGVTIDGDITGDCLPNIIISGINIPTTASAVNSDGIIVNANNSVIQYLNLQSFTNGLGDALSINGDNNQVTGCLIGTDITGTSSAGTSNTNGISIGGSTSNTIGGLTACDRNVISGNTTGIVLGNSAGSGNSIIGNYIGVDASGTAALQNDTGIRADGDGLIIGNGTAAGRNVISGNFRGINLNASSNNLIAGNFIGTDVTGTIAIGNTTNGIDIRSGSNSNSIGDATPGGRNIIAGNQTGVLISGTNAANNLIAGNFIGTDVTGLTDLPNQDGVTIFGPNNFVGDGTTSGQNLVSGNSRYGIGISSTAALNNIIDNNIIGLASDLNGILGNTTSGVTLGFGESNIVRNCIIAFNGTGILTQSGFDPRGKKNIFSRNSIYSNTGPGIQITDNTQELVKPPVIQTTSLNSASGIAAPNTEVFLYADSLNEGQVFLNSAISDASGNWSVTFNPLTFQPGLFFLTALQDSAGNTSEFSNPLFFSSAAPIPKIYWTERIGRDINRSNTDGTSFENWGLNPSPDPNGIAIDTTTNKVYWTDNNEGAVYRGDIIPTGVANIETIFLDADNPASDIELDLINGKVYWANWVLGNISRANLDGSSQEIAFISGYNKILGLALDLTNAKIYWSNNDNTSGDNIPSIWTASLIDGSGATQFYTESAVTGEDYLFVDVDIDPQTQDLYWSAGQDGQTGNNKFYFSNTTPTPAPMVLTTVRGQPGGFEIDWITSEIYFVDDGVVSAEPPTVWVMNLDGTNQVPLLEGFSAGIETPKYLALGFPTVEGSISVSIPTITVTGLTEFCAGDSVLLQSSLGEAYQWYRDGSPIAGAHQQTYYAKVTGAYNVQVQDGPDLEFALLDVQVTAGVLPVITLQPLDQSSCDGAAVSFSVSATGSDLLYRWEEDSGSGFVSLNNGGVYGGTSTPDLVISSSTGLDGNLYRLIVTEAGFSVLCDIVSDTVQISSSTSPVAEAGVDQTICSTQLATLAGIISGGATSGVWSTTGDGGFDDSTLLSAQYIPGPLDIASGAVTLTLTTDAPASCPAASDQVIINLDPSPVIDAGVDVSICPDETVSLSGQIDANSTTPVWTTSGDGSFLDNTSLNTSYTPGTADRTGGSVLMVLTASPIAGSCPDVSDTISVTINQPLTSQEQSTSVRLGETVDIDLLNGAFTNPGDILTITITQQPGKGSTAGPTNGILTYSPNPTTVGSDTLGFEICNQCNLCTSNIAVIEIENDPPVAQVPPIGGETGSMITIDLTNIVTDPNNNIDTTSLRIVSGPANGAIAFFEGFVLMIDYRNSNFFGEDVIVIEVCDLSGACIQVELRITIDREDVNIIDAITPNGDGRHDFFEIENIQFYPDNLVQIFSRWGSKVAEIKGYDNVQRVFTGESEPAGTYYYIIDLKDGSERRSGDLLLKK